MKMDGFYWVLFEGEWRIGEYFSISDKWFLTGWEIHIDTMAFTEIDERRIVREEKGTRITMNELQQEKADLEAKIIAKHKEAEAATTAVYWLKKRLKVIEAEIAAIPKDQTPGEAIQDVSEGLK